MSCDFNCNECNISSSGGKTHQEILKKLCSIGRKSGLLTKSEWIPPDYSGDLKSQREEYTPHIDLVWLIDLIDIIGESKFDALSSLVSSWTNGEIAPEFLRFIPYAAFEVEVSDPTSKTIYADFHNLVSTRAWLKFVIIKEIREMNLERAKRIKESAEKYCGATDLFVLTTDMLENLKMRGYTNLQCSLPKQKITKVDDVQEKLMILAERLNLIGNVEFSPPECFEDFYVPRLDAAWLVPIPEAVKNLTMTIRENCSLKTAKDPCHLTLFGFEHEEGTSLKHIAGGIANLSRHSYIGFLVTPSEKVEKMRRVISRYSRVFGLNNVFCVGKETIEVSDQKL